MTALEFDSEVALNHIDQHLYNTMRDTAFVFLSNALPHVRVDTGFSIFSFAKLGKLLSIPTSQFGFYNTYLPENKYTPPKLYRDKRNGLTLEKTEENAETLGGPKNPIKPNLTDIGYTFEYWSRVWYFVWLDTQWGAFEAGQKAALRYLKTKGYKGFPQLSKYMIPYQLNRKEGTAEVTVKRLPSTKPSAPVPEFVAPKEAPKSAGLLKTITDTVKGWFKNLFD